MKSRIWWIAVLLTALGLLGAAVAAVAAKPAVAQVAGPPGLAGINTWTKTGPMWNINGGLAPQVIQILIDPSDPNIVYAGTNQGVYRSTDGGETWEPRNGGLGGYGDLVISGIARHPTNPNTLYIATWGYGLFRSTDAGLNWTRLTDPLATGIQANTALPPGAPEVRAGGYSYSWRMPEMPEAAPGKALPPALPDSLRRHPHEGGVDLQALPSPLSWTPVRRVAINPTNANEIYACIDAGEGLYKSTDGGTGWSRVDLGPPTGLITASARTYVFAPSNSNIRYASFGSWDASGGFYRTTNGGTNWTPVGGTTITRTVTAVAIHPTNPNIVLAATAYGGLYRSTDGGNSWTPVSTGLVDNTFFSVAFAPSNPNIAYAGGYLWVYRSADGGQTWSNADSSFPTYYIGGLAIHPNSQDTVLIGANDYPLGGVYKRTSSTAPFALKATGMDDTFVLRIEQDPNNSNILYAATWGGGAFISDDKGNTWSLLGGVPYIYDIEATRGPTCTIIYAATFYSDWGVLKRYMDGSSPWVEVSRGYDSDISFDIESLGGSPTNLLAATENGVQYSNNGGQTWTTAAGLNSGVVLKLAVSPTSYGRVLAATYGGGVWLSTNQGVNWGESSTGLPSAGTSYVYDVAFAPDGTAYAATLGVYRRTNGGQSWSAAYTGANDWFRALDVATNGTVVAGSNIKGVYFGLGNGASWTARNAGLTEQRIRAIKVVQTTPDLTVMAGTNGRSGWLYTLKLAVYLPLVMRQPPSAPIINGDFESGPTGWTEYSTHGWDLIINSGFPTGVTPHSGNWAVWLGGEYDEISYIQQQVTVPPSSPYLAYWHWISSEDLCGYDFGGVIINGSTVVDVYTLCASRNTGGWVKRVVNLSAYSGQSVSLQIRAETDSSLNSNLFIDDVSFQASATSMENGLSPFDLESAMPKLDKAISQDMGRRTTAIPEFLLR